MPLIKTACFSIFLLLHSAAGYSETITGRVIGVSDGDTIKILTEENQQIKVRLSEIDAPEKKQAFGQQSKESLSDLCQGQDAKVETHREDRYGRTLGHVFCRGEYANALQVNRGMAWVYDKYVTDRSLYGLQDGARAAKRGLWVDSNPIPPWEWRRLIQRK